MIKRLQREFFLQPTIKVAKKLLGNTLVFKNHRGIITETESYIGEEDPACHAAKGLTPRTKIMYGSPGHTYVYLIYGMYHCLNFVTEKEGFPAAVLIRGIKLITPPKINIDGPGKLCKFLEITKLQNGIDITKDENFFIENTNKKVSFKATPRIGINVGKDKLWRFVIT